MIDTSTQSTYQVLKQSHCTAKHMEGGPSKAKAGHSRTSSVTASVHYSSTGDSVVIGMDNSNQ